MQFKLKHHVFLWFGLSIGVGLFRNAPAGFVYTIPTSINMPILAVIQKDHVFGHALVELLAVFVPPVISYVPRVANGQKFPRMKAISVCPGIA